MAVVGGIEHAEEACPQHAVELHEVAHDMLCDQHLLHPTRMERFQDIVKFLLISRKLHVVLALGGDVGTLGPVAGRESRTSPIPPKEGGWNSI